MVTALAALTSLKPGVWGQRSKPADHSGPSSRFVLGGLPAAGRPVPQPSPRMVQTPTVGAEELPRPATGKQLPPDHAWWPQDKAP